MVVLLAEPVHNPSIQYMDFVEIFNVSLELFIVYFIFLILVGVELPLCIPGVPKNGFMFVQK